MWHWLDEAQDFETVEEFKRKYIVTGKRYSKGRILDTVLGGIEASRTSYIQAEVNELVQYFEQYGPQPWITTICTDLVADLLGKPVRHQAGATLHEHASPFEVRGRARYGRGDQELVAPPFRSGEDASQAHHGAETDRRAEPPQSGSEE